MVQKDGGVVVKDQMKALIKERETQGFSLKEVEIPSELGPNDVLVKVLKASICGTDVHIFSWDEWSQRRIKPPQVVGHEFFGKVADIGSNVSSVKVGDVVTAETHIPCGKCLQCRTGRMHICKNLKILGVDIDGVFAEYVRVPEVVLWKLDPSIPEDFASVMEPFGNAVHTCAPLDMRGMRVLITGAGPIGAFSVGLSKLFGASLVIVTELNETRKNLAKRMGADIVLDPRKDDVLSSVSRLTEEDGADILLEMSGNESALIQGLSCLTNGGIVSILGVYPSSVTMDINSLLTFKGITLYAITGRKMFETWRTASSLLKHNRIDITPVITHVFSFEKWQEAMQTMMSGHSGKIILNLE